MTNTMDAVTRSEFLGGTTRCANPTLLPDPLPQPLRYTIFSVDDHYLEPGDVFTARVPSQSVEGAPRVVEGEDGGQYWQVADSRVPMVVFNAVVGRPREEWTNAAGRFEEFRPGTYDVHARVRDMDLVGVAASICFPSSFAGFAGSGLLGLEPGLYEDCIRAYNDWVVEEWTAAAPDRFVPNQLVPLRDPGAAAAEIRRNAARGFKSVSFPETPTKLGLASLNGSEWDPFLRACEETQTVVNLHVGSGGALPLQSSDAPMPETLYIIFHASSMLAANEWLWSQIPVRFPDLRIVMSEGGMGWVPIFHDQLRRKIDASRFGPVVGQNTWSHLDVTPLEVFRRNFRFAVVYDEVAMLTLDAIGPETVMLEVDYPHADSTWPYSQAVADAHLASLSPDVQAMVSYGNAAELYRHPVTPFPGTVTGT